MKRNAKTILFLFILAFAFSALADEVVFIPGWLTEKTQKAEYETVLRRIYPNQTINVMTWESNKNWNKAMKNADDFARVVGKYIEEKSEKERAGLTLIGHSLGARIVVRTADELAAKKIRVKQIVLLGAAIEYDIDADGIFQCSETPVINVFSRNDSVLKYLCGNALRKLPLGFCGAEKVDPEELSQYSFSTSEAVNSNLRLDLASAEMMNHMAGRYLAELEKIRRGEVEPYKPKYDYSDVKIKKGFLSLPSSWIVPPLFKMDLLDSYADWSVAKSEVEFHPDEDARLIPFLVRAHQIADAAFSSGDDEVEVKENTIFVYFIVDPYGRIAMWNFLYGPLKKRFDEIKSQIREAE